MTVPGPADLVSIVIPVFNGADYLAQAIDSALAQTWPHIEVIVVDDGSNDDGRTRAVIDSYGARIRLVAKANGGVATALNAGIAAMRGRWFSWLSHDDLYLPGKVETQLQALVAAGGEAIVFSDVEHMDAAGAPIARQACTEGFDPAQPLWAIFDGRLNGCAMLLPRGMIETAGGFDPGLPTTQDYALWFNLLRRHPLLPLPGVLVRQRAHPGQGSRQERHLVEAGLLWAEMLDSLTPAEVLRHAPNEMAFLRRIDRGMGGTTYPAAAATIAARIAERLSGLRTGVVWATDGADFPDGGPHRALAAIADAGLAPAGAIVFDATHDAQASLALWAAAGADVPVLRSWPHQPPGALLEAAAGMDAAVIVLTEAGTALPPTTLREAAAMILAGEADGVLLAEGAASAGRLLPPALRGAVLSMDAVRAALARAEALPGTDAAAALGLVARLAVRPAVGLREQPPAAVTHHDPVPALAAGPEWRGASSRAGRVALRLAERLHGRMPGLRPWIGPAVARAFVPAGFLDPQAYLEANPDIRSAGADPHLHYLLHGWREGRRRSPRQAPPRPAPMPPATAPIPAARHDRPCRLLILHGIGGGTRRYADLLSEQARRDGVTPILAWGIADSDFVIEGLPGHGGQVSISLAEGPGAVVTALGSLRMDGIDILHTIGLDEAVVPLLRALGRPYDVTLLDYHLIATQPHLLGADGSTAALGDAEARLRDVLRSEPHPVLAGAKHVFACSNDLAARVMRLVPGLTVTALPSLERPVPERYRVTPPAPIGAEEPMRVLFIGGFTPHKGSEVMVEAAAEAARRGLPLVFHQLGGLHGAVPPGRQSPATLRLHGAFQGHDLPALVTAIRPHLAWFPAMAPETYGFALSEAMLLGLPILARGLGAYPERLAGRPFTWVVPGTADNGAAAWVERFLRLRESGLAAGTAL